MNRYKFVDIYLGLEETFKVVITPEKIDKFLEISGDLNPLHVDAEYSKSKGFKNRVVHGMLTSSFLSTLVGIYLPGKYCILQGVEIQFSKPVYLNDTLTITGKVNYINQAYKQIEIKAMITNQKNNKVLKAKILAGVLDE